MTNILCIGAGYVGGPTMAMLAKYCTDARVTVADINPERIAQWNSDKLPIYEPGLPEVVKEARGRNLFFTTEVAKGITDADIIFVSINTPTKTFGHGSGKSADLQYWEATARMILKHSNKEEVIVVEKSTLPVRAADAMARILKQGNQCTRFEVVSNPEFLAEGTAIADLENPDRVLIGGNETVSGRKAAETLADLYAHWVPREQILLTNTWSSELSKLVANAMLAQRISSINSISALCEKTEASISEVSKAVGMDKRIGSRFLEASVGFGGSCFRKDIMHLSYLCEHYGLLEVARYWEGVVTMNDYQTDRFFKGILENMFNTLAGKRIAIFGFAFKPDTGDTRDSPALPLCAKLLSERARLIITDPQALDNSKVEMADLGAVEYQPKAGDSGEEFPHASVRYEADPYKAAEGAHAIAILTHWQEYKELDYQRIFDVMEKPAFLFDGRNWVDHNALHKIGFNVFPLGRSPLKHV